MNDASTKLMDVDLSTCIDDCLRCYRTCLDTVVKRGLAEGASRLDAKHIRLILTCVEMCHTAVASPLPCLRGMCGNLLGVCEGMRTCRRHGRMCRGLSFLCR